jgi:hypothetical protein
MRTIWLILGSLMMPLVWGWISNRLVAWLWPEKLLLAGDRKPLSPRGIDPLDDYQI